jgi:hypothetical protein
MGGFWSKLSRWPVFSRIREDRRGSISVEVALVAILLIGLTVGAVDIGRVVADQMRLSSAAAVGARFATQNDGSTLDAAGIAAVVRKDASDTGNKLVVGQRLYCACPGATSSSCTSLCSDGGYPPRYAEVTVTDQISLMLDYPGFSSPVQLTGASRMRMR